MRTKWLVFILSVGFLSHSVQAGFEQFNDPAGGMNVFNTSGGYQFPIVPFDLPNLRALTSDNRTFELLPNVNLYADNPGDPVWRNNSGAGPDGNAIIEANTLFELDGITADITSVVFEYNVDESYDLDPRYEVTGFIKVLDKLSGSFSTLASDVEVVDRVGLFQLQLNISGALEGQLLQAGWTLKGRNANPVDDWGSAIVTASNLYAVSSDVTAPSPDPMVFAVPPAAVSDSAISMTASNATDNFYAVEYLFTNTVNNSSSGWQSSPTWIDNGPSAGVVTSELPIVNAEFATDGSDWTFETNVGYGDPSSAIWTNVSANGVALASVNGSEDNGNGGFAVIYQGVSLDGTGFSGGDTVTLSADIRALAGLNGGGAILKMESYANGSTLNADLEVPITGTTFDWENYSIDYTIASAADEVRIVLGTSTGWGGQNATDSYYLFDNVVVSGEVTVPAGLAPETLYTYRVKARDTGVNANETAWSDPASATTNSEDNEAPSPAQMSFAATDASPNTVKLTATTATDDSGVEYYFKSVGGGGNNSGWQSSPIYYDTGLQSGSNYSYTVIARDTSSAANSNMVSSATNVTTTTVQSGPLNNALTGYSGSTDDPETAFQLEKAGLTTGSTNPDATVDFGASGAVFGDGIGASGRNVLKTIASGYQGVSFEAYATLTFSGAVDLSGFIGIGQGVQTGVPDNFGVPELNLEGVNGVVAQFKDATAASGVPNCNLYKFIGGNSATAAGGNELLSDPVGSTETIRARLIYDAVAETVNVSFDKNYTGGTFTVDQDMGTISTTNATSGSMWDGAPVRVYAGGGEGTLVKDFEIVVTRADQPAFDVQTVGSLGVGGESIFTWDGELGRYYDVQYTTNLVTGPWINDPTPGATNIFSETAGSISATSTVSEAAVFYRIISR